MASEIRSLLFVPGDKEAIIHKALASQADAVIIDLEDAVDASRKDYARDLVGDFLAGRDLQDKPVFVRVNAFDAGLTAQDLAGVMPGRPSGVMLPKAASCQEVDRLGYYLDALEAREGITAESTRILTVATETAAATLGLGQQHHGTNPRLWGMLWGGEDLSATLGAFSNRDEAGDYTFHYQYARSQCLYAANAAGVQPIDAVYTDFRNSEGLELETRAALRDGFTAKAAIHPAQAEVINRVMTPTKAQFQWACEVLELLAQQGVARLEGKMIDIAHKRVAQRIIDRRQAVSAN